MTHPDETSLFDPRQFDPRHVRDQRSATSVAAAARQAPPPAPHPAVPQYRTHLEQTQIVPMSAVAACAFTLGLLSLVTFGFFAVPAVVCGHIGLRHTRTGAEGGRGLAAVGALLGWLAIAGWTLFWLLLAVGAVGSLRGVQ